MPPRAGHSLIPIGHEFRITSVHGSVPIEFRCIQHTVDALLALATRNLRDFDEDGCAHPLYPQWLSPDARHRLVEGAGSLRQALSEGCQ